jgi:hypothetical protein
MAKTFGMLFGIIFLAIGILGFVPGITTNDMLLGIFMVNKAHSIVHVASGAIFLIASTSGQKLPACGSRSSVLFTRSWPLWASSSATG